MHATGRGEVGGYALIQDRYPPQGQAERLAITISTDERSFHRVECLEVDIRLIEAIEQHEAVGADLDQARGAGGGVTQSPVAPLQLERVE
jgi:hypothetical protein